MKFRNRPLVLSIVLVLLLALMLPMFCACDSDGAKTEESETAETKEKENSSDHIPMVDLNNPNVGDSLESTPNKGGNKVVESGTGSVKSAFSQAMEKLEEEQKNAYATQSSTVSARRELAELYMRTLLTVRWTPETDIQYGLSSATGTDFTFKAGRTYSGIPYTNGSNGLEAFALYTKEGTSDVVKATFTQKQLSGSNTAAVVGADGVDALLYAWNKVSDTSFAHSTADMIPLNGFLFLGDYQIPQMEDYDGYNVSHDFNPHEGNGQPSSMTLTYDKTLKNDTDDICNYNGEDKMYAAYAQLLKADALICDDDEKSAAYMVVSADIVYKADGSIDGEKSTVTVLYQTNELFENETVKDGVYLIGSVDEKISFKTLFEENFIPLTIQEFKDGATARIAFVRDSLNAAKDYTAANLYKGFITTGQRVVSAEMMLLNENGEYLFDYTTLSYQGDVKVAQENRFGFDVTKILTAGRGVGDESPIPVADLEKGKTYTCILTLNLVDGSEVVAREFTFEA